MEYQKKKDLIIIKKTDDFDVVQTLECGQIFRFLIKDKTAQVFCLDKMAKINFEDDIVIETKDVDFFENFFDLKTDYSEIKKQLGTDEFLAPAVKYGHGIRIIKNDCYEMLISFIISANNNIKRIKNSIDYLCKHFGSDMGDYFAFPTLKQLKTATLNDFVKAGLGYRAPQMLETVDMLTDEKINDLLKMNEQEQFNFLLSLKGIGEKVANCVMLFGLGNKNVFPVDTWINKVYNNLTHTTETNRKKITKELTSRYKDLSGYAQQYFFFYYRDNKLN